MPARSGGLQLSTKRTSLESSFFWLLRLVVGALVLWAWVAVGLGGGIARADDPSPSTSEHAVHSGSPAAPSASKLDRPKRSHRANHHGGSADTTESQTRHSSRPASLTVVATKRTKPVTVAPARQTVAEVAALDPPASSNRSVLRPARVPQRGRPAVGLVSDVGMVTASVVYTAANTVADAVEPHSVLGTPYLLATAVANSAAAVGRTFIGAPPGSASTGPFHVTYGVVDARAIFRPQEPPPGANDPSITVTPEHPLPIILLNGTTATQGLNWAVGAPVLANAGYKVYTFNYGNVTSNPNWPIQATNDIRVSGLELAAEVDEVLTETGAPEVILIGHSQGGGILAVYYINNLGGADKVSQLIGIAPSNHGTDLDGLIVLQELPILGRLIIALANKVGPALEQQAVGNAFQQVVYGNGDTRPGVLYTTVASTNDEVV
ncbi:MAG TPA: alpha/beta fold hydrolase, partial [Mycobacterium sp.]|nr:alpha/beta fold hydrolase [Mycobacterium sp.]